MSRSSPAQSIAPSVFLERVAFLDVEASAWPAEGGFAIEAAFVTDAGAAWSSLITPPPVFPARAWSMRAQAVHGIGQEAARREGLGAAEVCAALNAGLAGLTVFSDNPDFDAAWLGEMFARADVRPGFRLLPAARSWEAFDCASDFTLLWEEAERSVEGPAHRAGPDAARLLAVWRLAKARWESAPCRFAP
jgi:hypothetical protein